MICSHVISCRVCCIYWESNVKSHWGLDYTQRSLYHMWLWQHFQPVPYVNLIHTSYIEIFFVCIVSECKVSLSSQSYIAETVWGVALTYSIAIYWIITLCHTSVSTVVMVVNFVCLSARMWNEIFLKSSVLKHKVSTIVHVVNFVRLSVRPDLILNHIYQHIAMSTIVTIHYLPLHVRAWCHICLSVGVNYLLRPCSLNVPYCIPVMNWSVSLCFVAHASSLVILSSWLWVDKYHKWSHCHSEILCLF